MQYKIGIDGGGTKTEYALFADSRIPILSLTGRGSNHETLPGGMAEAASILADGIGRLLDTANIPMNKISRAAMGLAGMDYPSQIRELTERLRALGIPNPVLCNDGFLIVKAGSPSGFGIGYNAGSGTCAVAIDQSGGMLQFGGFSDFSGDKGNAYWNTARTYRAVYDDVVLGLRKTLLTELYFREFQIHTEEELIQSVQILQSRQAASRIPVINTMLFTAAAANDTTAIQILDEITDRASDFLSCLALRMPDMPDPIPVILSGSVHCRQECPLYIEQLRSKSVWKCRKNMEFSVLRDKPVIGAFYL